MIVLNDKIAFIHVPKTAGTTVSSIFSVKCGITNSISYGMHTGMTEAVKRFPDVPFHEYEVLIIARNPWERNASYYTQAVVEYERGMLERKPVEPILYFIRMPQTAASRFLSLMTLNNKIPNILHVLHFDNLETDINKFWKDNLGDYDIVLPRLREKENKYYDLQKEICANTEFQEIIAEKCKEEIEMFNYSIPTYIP